MSKTQILMVRKGGGLFPITDLDDERLQSLRRDKPVLVMVSEPRNPEHHRKLWAIAAAVANFDKNFLDGEDAVEWVKLHIPNMHKQYTLRNGAVVIKTRSINWATMDQLAFGRFYDRAIYLWSEKIGCDPETLLEQTEAA